MPVLNPKTMTTYDPASDIQNLLFATTEDHTSKLFDNVPDLGRTIAALPNSQYAKKESNATAFLRQVFNGSRPCPDDLLSLILDATRVRAINRQFPGSIDELLAQIQSSIKSVQVRQDRRVRDKLGFSKKLVAAMANSDTRLVINPPLNEIRISPSFNQRASKILVEKLALLDKDGVPDVRYKICYPAEAGAIDFWRLLFEELTGKNGEPDAGDLDSAEAISRINRVDESNDLQIYLVPYYLCLSAAVIYDPDQDDCVGYLLQLIGPGVSKPFEIRSQDIIHWRQVYIDLERGRFKPYERMNFCDYRTLISKQSK